MFSRDYCFWLRSYEIRSIVAQYIASYHRIDTVYRTVIAIEYLCQF